MKRDRAIAVIRAHEPALRRAGVAGVTSLFGSVAHDDVRPASDIDLAVRLTPGFSAGGFDYFGRFEDLRAELAATRSLAIPKVWTWARSQPMRRPAMPSNAASSESARPRASWA
jgi:predicted nucleotidyltransferase